MLFISYSTRDLEEAQSICDYLRDAKVDYWISCERLDGEENWQSQVSHAIHQCTSFLILLSRNVRKSSYQLVQELAIANSLQREGLRIFGLSLDGDTFWRQPGSFEYVLRSKEVRDCSLGAREEIERLVTNIRSYEKAHGEPLDKGMAFAYQTIKAVDCSSSKFLMFAGRILASFYGLTEDALASYRGQLFPDLALPASPELRGFDLDQFAPEVQSSCQLDLDYHPKELPLEGSLAAQVANFYAKVPVNYPCYMNKAVRLNDSGEVTCIETFVGTRKQNVMTTSTLRNEFYLTYSKLKDEGRLESVDNTEFAKLSERRSLAKETCGEGLASLLLGAGGYSEFGVQGIVLMPISPTRRDGALYSYRQHAGEYWVPILRRGSMVEEQPGFYQFAPCGGFGMIGSPTSEVFQMHAIGDFDLFNGLMYRYCDELFAKRSKGRGASSSGRSILRGGDLLSDNEHYLEMLNLIEEGLATIEFLGISSSLISLKSDLVFCIVIKDPEYYRRNKSAFHPSKESAELTFLPLSLLLNESIIEGNMAEEISAPLQLLRQSSSLCEVLQIV